MLKPKISCITTLFNEGKLIGGAIESLLGQTFNDFELILVDDGSEDDTVEVVRSFKDSRIKLIQQANSGLSVARNTALSHVQGSYLCFLDADDSRPFWALERIQTIIESSTPDVIFCNGILSEPDTSLVPFYNDGDLLNFASSALNGENSVDSSKFTFPELLAIAQLLEPQSANKIVCADYLRKNALCFPCEHFFEDIYFHTACVATAKSISFISDPLFTYYQRYGKPQITAATSKIRFDILAVARMTLNYFISSTRKNNPILRAAVLVSVFRLVNWCNHSISHQHRYAFNELKEFVFKEMSPLYKMIPDKLPEYFNCFDDTIKQILFLERGR